MAGGGIRTIGIVHPGAMGATVGGLLAGTGRTIVWASAGRGPDTVARAEAAGLTDAGTLKDVSAESDAIFSICPPHAAVDVARELAGFGGLYVDANAVSPATASQVAEIVTDGGAEFVDGGIIGPPPTSPGTSRLYLAGARAADVARLFEGTVLDARVVTGGPVSASALKMAYACWTKGTTAMLLAAHALAEAGGVRGDLIEEWAISLPEIAGKSRAATAAAVEKGWRWSGEMEEIADTFAAAGLPDGFHRAAAEIYRRAEGVEMVDGDLDATLERVVASLLHRGPAAR